MLMVLQICIKKKKPYKWTLLIKYSNCMKYLNKIELQGVLDTMEEKESYKVVFYNYILKRK